MDYKKKINELVNIVNNANYEYYVLDNPSLSDQEYDNYFSELKDLEKKYPQYIMKDSPTNKIGTNVIINSKKIRHGIPMLSLRDVRNYDDVKKFDNYVNIKEYVCELKIDGISVSLIYENGKLFSASTRGNGIIGEDILESVKMIKDIPKVLKIPINCEIRGEIYMDKVSFVECNKWRNEHGDSLFSSARNAASGCVRNSEKIVKKWLSSFMYTLVNADDFSIRKHSDALCFIKELGFCVNELNKYVNNIDGAIEYINNFSDIRNSLLYDVDGIVIKVDDLSEQNYLGNTSRYPKWAIAYKFSSSFVYTKLNDIIVTVGRTGKVTPIAIFDLVNLMGNNICRATLHNYSYILNKDIRIGDIICVIRSGDVIPRVDYSLSERRIGNEEIFAFPMHCPACNGILVKRDNDYYCINVDCPAKCIERLIHFADRNAMNLIGLGDVIIEDFYNCGFLKEITDFYCLSKYYDDIISMGFLEKELNYILCGIESSKNNSLEKFIYGLGIKRVGFKNASILAKKFKSIESLMNASIFDLANIHDIGNVIARNIYYYFKNDDNRKMIEKFISYGLTLKYSEEIVINNENFYGKNFVLTGSFCISRNDMVSIILSFGGKVSSYISSKTDVLIVGVAYGSKYDKAIELGISIWNYDKFLKMSNIGNY